MELVGYYIIKSLKSYKDLYILILPYNCSQITKNFIKAQRFVNIIKSIIESLFLVFFYIQKRSRPVFRIFFQRCHNSLDTLNPVCHYFHGYFNCFLVFFRRLIIVLYLQLIISIQSIYQYATSSITFNSWARSRIHYQALSRKKKNISKIYIVFFNIFIAVVLSALVISFSI